MKIKFSAVLDKFASMGEKTGWTYLKVPQKISDKLMPGRKLSFRVKGRIDQHLIEHVALIPFGGGDFIMAINATMRKATGKKKGDKVELELEVDHKITKLNAEFLECLEDEPSAEKHFKSMPPSHQQYYSNWIDSAKTEATKIKRISLAINTLSKGMNYGEMIREGRKLKGEQE